MSLYVRSPSGLLHVVAVREREGRERASSRGYSGLYRTACGRLAERGWSQRPRAIRDPGDPHVCRVCRELRPIEILGTRAEIDQSLASARKMERDIDAKIETERLRRERAS